MTNRWSLALFLALALFTFSLRPAAVTAQTQTPSPKETLLQAVRARAERDVTLDREPQGATGLDLLFGQEASQAGVSLRELLEVYEEAYLAAAPEDSLQDQVLPNAGWIAAILTAVAAVVGSLFREAISGLVKRLYEGAYAKVAGLRLFRRTSLRRYRAALLESHGQIKIPFRPDRPLPMAQVYVPLKASGARDSDLLDAYQAIGAHGRLMIKGAPGSGKSTFMRRLALTYAEGGLREVPGKPIPILLELNRLNDSDLSLEEHLVAVLDRHGFPKAGGFVHSGLESGAFLLLLDGFDEVIGTRRDWVKGQIVDLLREYKDCRGAITCRTAVYRDEFAAVADRTLEVVEFSDRQIERFLEAWRADMPPGKSIRQLIRTLRDRPRIMALARNPLLLTIIAFLYTDIEFVLPHSRAEFYRQSSDVLLRQWKTERNQYNAPSKGLLLQHLALFNQDRGAAGGEDRRSIPLTAVLAQVRAVLPELNLGEKEAQPILDEIVERSGLLLSIDGGSLYQFAHLTLQEYFAAEALRDNEVGLLDRFAAEPANWRETVKLWCGLDRDSTHLITAVRQIDAITALESLADAQKIDPGTAERIVSAFRPRLAEEGPDGEAIVRAFAALASDTRPRGQDILRWLERTLEASDVPAVRAAAATSLSLTNLPEAAAILSRRYEGQPELLEALVAMGDLAVESLAKEASGDTQFADLKLDEKGIYDTAPMMDWSRCSAAMGALVAIGTARAAGTLADLLWLVQVDFDSPISILAAHHLAAMTDQPAVEAALNKHPLPDDHEKLGSLDWVWAPFEDDNNPSMAAIAGRIVWLLDSNWLQDTNREMEPNEHIDPRLAIPALIPDADGISKRLNEIEEELVKDLRARTPLMSTTMQRTLRELAAAEDDVSAEVQKVENLIDDSLEDLPGKKWALDRMPRYPRFMFLHACLSGDIPSERDWRNLYKELRYDIDRSRHFGAVILIFLLLTAGVFGRAVEVYLILDEVTFWPATLAFGSVVAVVLTWLSWAFEFDFFSRDFESFLFGHILGLIVGPMLVFEDFTISNLFMGIAYLLSVPALIYANTVWLLAGFQWYWVLGIWLALSILVAALLFFADRKQRDARNPLRGVLGDDETDLSVHVSEALAIGDIVERITPS